MAEDGSGSTGRPQFTTVLRGYDKQEVDRFLDERDAEMRELRRAAHEARAGAEASYQRVGEELGELLQQAHDWSAQTTKDAESEALRVRTEALSEATRITTDAETHAERVRKDTEQHVQRTIAEGQAVMEKILTEDRTARRRIAEVKRELARVVERLDEVSTKPEPRVIEGPVAAQDDHALGLATRPEPHEVLLDGTEVAGTTMTDA